mmetsp:Transcript_8955/g.7957  ORF Transcript_8955/g.7957 Transcript_8955/m.7957 type:complete len:149 (+) Transcript_8955:707-1153(+)
MISDYSSDIYRSAHLCIDLVFLYSIMHLSMLEISICTFKMKDYKSDFSRYSQYYSLLVQSYIEQAMSNYISPIVLNYHNQYSSFTETEEIYYELSSTVIHKHETNKEHYCWTRDVEEMEKDHMFYNFKHDKLVEIDPPFLIGSYSPVM